VNKFRQVLIGSLFSIVAFDAMALISPPSISGTLEMTGAAYMVDARGNITSDATSAIGIDFSPNKFITTLGDGSFSGVSRIGYIQDLQFDSFAGPIANFWSIDAFSFELLDLSFEVADTVNSSFLTVTGNGIISAQGYADTAASWRYSSDSSGGSLFGWSATAKGVPEPSILALLSLGLITIVLRKKLNK